MNNLIFSPLWYRGKVQRSVPPLDTQCLNKSAKTRKRKCLNYQILSTYPATFELQREAKKTLLKGKFKYMTFISVPIYFVYIIFIYSKIIE